MSSRKREQRPSPPDPDKSGDSGLGTPGLRPAVPRDEGAAKRGSSEFSFGADPASFRTQDLPARDLFRRRDQDSNEFAFGAASSQLRQEQLSLGGRQMTVAYPQTPEQPQRTSRDEPIVISDSPPKCTFSDEPAAAASAAGAQVMVKREPGTVLVKREPGIVAVKSEPGTRMVVKQAASGDGGTILVTGEEKPSKPFDFNCYIELRSVDKQCDYIRFYRSTYGENSRKCQQYFFDLRDVIGKVINMKFRDSEWGQMSREDKVEFINTKSFRRRFEKYFEGEALELSQEILKSGRQDPVQREYNKNTLSCFICGYEWYDEIPMCPRDSSSEEYRLWIRLALRRPRNRDFFKGTYYYEVTKHFPPEFVCEYDDHSFAKAYSYLLDIHIENYVIDDMVEKAIREAAKSLGVRCR